MVSGDFDGDGKDDIAAMYDYTSPNMGIHVWLSTGSSFTYQGNPGWYTSGGYNAALVTGRMVAGDFNGDGKDDIVAMYDYGSNTIRLHVWTSTGSAFNAWQSWYLNSGGYDASRVTGRVVAGDFNGDGKCDVGAMYDYGNNSIKLHVWTCTGSLWQNN